jgi:hypothetical protein
MIDPRIGVGLSDRIFHFDHFFSPPSFQSSESVHSGRTRQRYSCFFAGRSFGFTRRPWVPSQ